jgi:AcrR family transcriptional regulator
MVDAQATPPHRSVHTVVTRILWRLRILNAAHVHFAEIGLEGASVQKIGEAATTLKITVGPYLGYKEALFNAVANQDHTSSFDLDIESMPLGNPHVAILRLAHRYMDLFAAPPFWSTCVSLPLVAPRIC